jgi:hypothetical protein
LIAIKLLLCHSLVRSVILFSNVQHFLFATNRLPIVIT